jgi:hypothetical protein
LTSPEVTVPTNRIGASTLLQPRSASTTKMLMKPVQAPWRAAQSEEKKKK